MWIAEVLGLAGRLLVSELHDAHRARRPRLPIVWDLNRSGAFLDSAFGARLLSTRDRSRARGCDSERGIPMNDGNTTRRRVLKILVGGATVAILIPSKWFKPIVESVVVPAHAQASPARTPRRASPAPAPAPPPV
jgi:hypothetical protein